jgi:hypothetical protein
MNFKIIIKAFMLHNLKCHHNHFKKMRKKNYDIINIVKSQCLYLRNANLTNVFRISLVNNTWCSHQYKQRTNMYSYVSQKKNVCTIIDILHKI